MNNCENENSKLLDIYFSVKDVEKLFRSLKRGSAPGPDDLATDILKECSTIFAPVFHVFYRRYLNEGDVPTALKTAKITPIPKGGNKQLDENWRPIAITSHIITRS